MLCARRLDALCACHDCCCAGFGAAPPQPCTCANLLLLNLPPRQAFPEAPVIFHSHEAPFLLGDKEYLPPDSTALRALRALGIAPAQRVKARWGAGRLFSSLMVTMK